MPFCCGCCCCYSFCWFFRGWGDSMGLAMLRNGGLPHTINIFFLIFLKRDAHATWHCMPKKDEKLSSLHPFPLCWIAYAADCTSVSCIRCEKFGETTRWGANFISTLVSPVRMQLVCAVPFGHSVLGSLFCCWVAMKFTISDRKYTLPKWRWFAPHWMIQNGLFVFGRQQLIFEQHHIVVIRFY